MFFFYLSVSMVSVLGVHVLLDWLEYRFEVKTFLELQLGWGGEEDETLRNGLPTRYPLMLYLTSLSRGIFCPLLRHCCYQCWMLDLVCCIDSWFPFQHSVDRKKQVARKLLEKYMSELHCISRTLVDIVISRSIFVEKNYRFISGYWIHKTTKLYFSGYHVAIGHNIWTDFAVSLGSCVA